MTAVMRFLTRERIGFRVRGIDQQTVNGASRCTRWSRVWRGGKHGVRVVVDHQHTTVLGPPYWQARVRVGLVGVDLSTGPRP